MLMGKFDSKWMEQIDNQVLNRLLEIAYTIAQGDDVSELCDSILQEAQNIANADGGTIYLMDATSFDSQLKYAIIHNKTLNIKQGGLSKTPIDYQALPLKINGQPNHRIMACKCALTKEIINVADISQSAEFDSIGTQAFANQPAYTTKSVLTLPLTNSSGDVIGVLQLVNACNTDGQLTEFGSEIVPALEVLAAFAATLLDHKLTAENQRDLMLSLSAETNPQRLLEMILDRAMSITNADGGTLYMLEDDEQQAHLEFALMVNRSLGIHKGGQGEEPIELPGIPLYYDGQENHNNVASHVAISKQLINIEDAYTNSDFDFSGVKAFDQRTGYRSKSFLTFPLLNHDMDVIGVLQLINAQDLQTGETIIFHKNLENVIEGLAAYAAIALNNKILLQDHKNLLDAFIQCIAKAIDAKSSHTSNHCQRVPLLTELIAKAACEDSEKFKDFDLSDIEWYELHVASWMHDCGKLATPDTVLDKSTKLHTQRDGIETIKARFSALKAQTQLRYAERITNAAENEAALRQELASELDRIDQAKDFIITANKGGEFMSEESKQRVKDIAELQWQNDQGEYENILTEDEIYNLCIERGTLTEEERQIINNHMVVTIEMLESLPFPKTLKRVPEYAGGHHEKMDGSGFPRGLTRDQMSLPARMMAIADIFEALTSKDRPYKDPMKLSLALKILKNMRDNNHIDPDLYELFVTARVWEKYAESELDEHQKDVEDITPYL